MTEDPRINLVADALWRPGALPCPPIHNRAQAERAATLAVDALDRAGHTTFPNNNAAPDGVIRPRP